MKVSETKFAPLLWGGGLIVLTITLLWWRWIGYLGSDDLAYYKAAIDLVRSPYQLGQNHWALRYPVVLPIALTTRPFEHSLFAIVAPTVVCFFGILVLTAWGVGRRFGYVAAAFAVLNIITLPIILVQATYPSADITELFFAVASVWLFLAARERSGSAAYMLGAGATAALAFTTRETTLALLVAYGVLFVFYPGVSRWRYVLMGVGFALIVGAQVGFFTAMTGDPLYRQRISAGHDMVDRAAVDDRAKAEQRLIDKEGVIAAGALAPVMLLFGNPHFGLVFYAVIPVMVLLWRRFRDRPSERQTLVCIALIGLVWFLFVAGNWRILYLVPRYFLICGWAACVLVGIAAAVNIRRPVLLVAYVGYVLSALLMLELENTDPRFPERRLAAIAAELPAPIVVDPVTLRWGEMLYQIAGVGDRLSKGPPAKGSLVFVREFLLEDCRTIPNCVESSLAPYAPKPDWQLVRREEAPRKPIGRVLHSLGITQKMHPQLARKFEQPGAGWYLYRVP